MVLWGERKRRRAQPEGAPGDEARRLEQQWGVESCARCGRTIMLGEPLHRVQASGARVAVCDDCLETATRRTQLDRAA